MPERKEPPSPDYLAELVRQILGSSLADAKAGPRPGPDADSDDFLSPNRLARGAWAHLARLEQERGEAVFRVEELRSLSQDERRLRLEQDSSLHLWAVAERLLADSREHREEEARAQRRADAPAAKPANDSPGDRATGGATTATLAPHAVRTLSPAEARASEALVVLDHLDPGIYGAACVEDLYAQVHAALGLARLAEHDLVGAEGALGQAHEHLEMGSGDILSRAQLLDFESALRLAQNRFGEALTAIDRASRSFRTARDPHFEGLAQLRRAEILRAAGRRVEAVATCRKGLALIDSSRAATEALGARRALIEDLAALGHHDEAAAEAARPPALVPEET